LEALKDLIMDYEKDLEKLGEELNGSL